MVTASLVKELRDKTGAGMMECKKVLTETDGDMEKAAELLRERGITKAEKKSDRIAAEGLVVCYVTEDKKTGVVFEVNAETDFVAKNEQFKNFVENTAKHIAINNPKDVVELLEQKEEISGKTIKDILTENIATIGENMTIRRFARFQTNGLVQSYIHGEGKIGVLVELENADEVLAKDICMQIAAAKPEYLNRQEIPQEIVNNEMDILKAQAMNEGKPEQIAEKMVNRKNSKILFRDMFIGSIFC
jgi:elongation factor Ts